MEEHVGGVELELLKYCSVVWRLKIVVAIIFVAGSLLTAVVSLMMPEVYRAEAVITPVKSREATMGGGISTLAQQFGGLAGITLPDAGSNSEIVSLLESNILREKMLATPGFMQMIFADRWDKKNNRWNGNGSGTALTDTLGPRSSAAAPASPAGTPPTVWEGIRRLKEMVAVEKSARENTITIMADSPNAQTSARTVEYLLNTLNDHMSYEAQRVARINRAYLEGQLNAAVDPIIRQKIYALVAKQIEINMMAEVKENFAFKVIDPPMAPDQRISPRRTRIVLAGSGASLLAGVFTVFLFDFVQRHRRAGCA